MNAIAVIQARMSSARLPKKVVKPLAGKPMIWHIYQRAAQCKEVSQVVVATSSESSDDSLAAYCAENGLHCYRGSLGNVLSRFLDIRGQYPDSSHVVRITGDCPLIHPSFIDGQIRALQQHDADMLWMRDHSTVLEGQGVFSWRSLQWVNEHSSDERDLEHVGSPYISENPERFSLLECRLPNELKVDSVRLTVDEVADYQLMSRLYDELWKEPDGVNLYEALQWISSHQSDEGVTPIVEDSAINREVHERFRRWSKLPKVGVWTFTER